MRSLLTLFVAVFGFVTPVAALAGANKTWVSGTGTDSGNCAITAPCKTFQYAHDQTSAGGEIDVKDAGGYGTLVISKAISIVAEGVLASISVPAGGTGIAVNAGDSDRIVISGVTIDGHGGNGYGINVSSSAQTSIIKSTLRNLDTGIYISRNQIVFLKSSNVSNNGVYGVKGESYSTVYLSDNYITNNSTGVYSYYASTLGDNVFLANVHTDLNAAITSVNKK